MLETIGALPAHDLFVGLGVLVALVVFVAEGYRRREDHDNRLLIVVAGALAGGAVLARLGTWFQHVDLRANATLAEQWVYGNRSILGGLVGAWLGVHLTKRVTGYRARTGDLFAPAVAIGMAVGRVGCLLTEDPGRPTGADWGIVLTPAQAAATGSVAGVPLHPSFAYEIAFHLVAFLLLWFWLRHADLPPGELFVLYVTGYAVFRFAVEFVRSNEVVWAGMSRPQLFLLASLPLIAARLVVHARRGAYANLSVRHRPLPAQAPGQAHAQVQAQTTAQVPLRSQGVAG